MEYRQVIKQNKTMMYKLKYIKTTRITAKIDKNNDILVICPFGTSFEISDGFVLKYFEKFYEFFKHKKENSLIDLDNNIISLNGEKYEIKMIFHEAKRNKYEIINRKIFMHVRNADDKLKLLKKILNDLGNDYLIKRTKMLAKKYNFKNLKGVETKWYVSKWGQCNYTDKKITLAIQLYMMNDELIDYVILHELSHLVHPNHSPEFWSYLEKMYPNYKIAKNKLKFEC